MDGQRPPRPRTRPAKAPARPHGSPGPAVSLVSRTMPTPCRASRICASPSRTATRPRTSIRTIPVVDLEGPAVEIGVIARHDATVPRQVFGPLRCAVAGEVGRRGADQAFVLADLARHEAGVGEPADADGDVDALIDHVDHAVGRQQLELHQRIAGEELREHRRELMGGEGKRGRHPQHAARRAALAHDLVLQRLDLARRCGLGRGIEDLALLGEVQGAGRALQQPHAQPRFQPGDQLVTAEGLSPNAGAAAEKPLESTTRTKAAISLA